MEQATTTILEYGILGAVIFFLAVAVVYLWRENNQKCSKYKKMQ